MPNTKFGETNRSSFAQSQGRPKGEKGDLRRLGLGAATLIVIANMVGTGVFTTTGFLVQDIGSSAAVLLGWGLGGLIALAGALVYGELAAAISRNGGEYRFLADLYHPAVGFVAGWISLVVGFSAPIAASALAFGEYARAVWPGVPPVGAGIALVIIVSVLHALHVRGGSDVQNLFAVLKVILIAVFIIGGLAIADVGSFGHGDRQPMGEALLSPPFAVGLVFIAFAYSGWNGAAYIAGEVRRPARTMPIALLVGTLIVTVLYLGLNAVFLMSVPADELSGKVEVGHVAATALFGKSAGRLLSGLIAAALISSVSAMVMVGPRVYAAMGEDFHTLRRLSYRTRQGGPMAAIALQAVLAVAMLLTASFGALLTYIGFTLSLSAALTVGSIFILRRRNSYSPTVRTWGYPVTPLVFIGFSAWMVWSTLPSRPAEAIFGAATLVSGIAGYGLVRYLDKHSSRNSIQGDAPS